jgi:hypothetical protein
MAADRPPIYGFTANDRSASITRKVGIYGSEEICTIWLGSLGDMNGPISIPIQTLAEAMCHALEQERPRESPECQPQPDEPA